MASSSVRSSPAKMIRILSLQATPNADLKMWIDALPCHQNDDDHDDHDDRDHGGDDIDRPYPTGLRVLPQ